MKFDSKLPLKSRIAKRRKAKRNRTIAALLLSVLIVSGLYFMVAGGNINKVWSGFFKNFEDKGSNISENTVSGNNMPQTSSGSSLDKPETGSEIGNNDGSIEETAAQDSTAKTTAGISGGITEPKNVEHIKSKIENYINGFKGQYGVYYINLVNGMEFGINDEDEYTAASTVKVPINLQLFRRIHDGYIDPEGTMTYTKADYEGGTGSIQYQKIGTKYKIRELSRLSIEQSDNVAINMIIRLLGGRAAYKKFMRDVGGTVVDDTKNVSSPKDMALYMKLVYDFYNEDRELGGELIGYLENTIFNDRIPKLLPEDVKVAHKIGNQVGCLHDVGIVFGKEPYVISIMSKNVLESEAYDVIAKISRLVYDFAEEGK